jgi:hypothetical protein
VIYRLGIETFLEKSTASRGQKVARLTKPSFEQLQDHFSSSAVGSESVEGGGLDSQIGGLFYLIQLEPDHDPTRFKLGFTTNIEERLRAHKTAAPFSSVVKTWPCRLLWEKTAIESISRGCERVHTEVFRGELLEVILDRCEKFFTLMPSLEEPEQFPALNSP